MRVTRARALLAIPFLVVALGSLAARRAVPKWGTRIGRGASAFVSSLVPPRISPRSVRASLDEGAVDSLGFDVPDAESDDGDAGGPPEPFIVHVAADVAQWTIDDQWVHIHARPVRDSRGRPAGIRFTGFGVLGSNTGLRDGDILVSIDGEPALTEEVAIDRALDAVVHGRPTLRAIAMRRGRAVAVTVDLPPAPSGKAR